MARRRWRTELDELRDDTRSGAAEIESRAVAVLQVQRHGIEIEPRHLARKLRAGRSDPWKHERPATGEPLAECE